MTNGEWLKSKRDEFIQKSRNWIYKHIWIPIVVLAVFIVVTVYAVISVDILFAVSLYLLCMFETGFIVIAVCQWLDKEHKEKE